MSLSTLLVPTVASYTPYLRMVLRDRVLWNHLIHFLLYRKLQDKSEHCEILSYTNNIVLLTCIVKISSSSLVRIRFSLFLSTVNALTSNPDDMMECAEDSNKNEKKNILGHFLKSDTLRNKTFNSSTVVEPRFGSY